MKDGGTWRNVVTAITLATAGFFKRLKFWGPHHYADPHLNDPYHHQRSRRKAGRKGRKRLQMPDCIPGTITYRDWLVRELNYDRRLADGYIFTHLNGYKIKMPMPSDLVSQL